MRNVVNFAAGPAMLPEAVLRQAQQEMFDWRGCGMSVMEMSHRGKEFTSIAADAEADLRTLMRIPENYKVLFLQGGASTQFAMIPMNLAAGRSVDFVNTGNWSTKAIEECAKFAKAREIASSAKDGFTSIPDPSSWDRDENAAYLHYTSNETIGGVEYHFVPDSGDVPLVADMSSNILSCPVDVSKFGMIYAGAQKNIGPAGLTLVIVREDLVGAVADTVPTMMSYQTFVKTDSMYNTPPTYGWYLAGLVFKWLLNNGGLEAMAEVNARKAKMLYDTIDGSDFYHNPVAVDARSRMNVPFTLANADLDSVFLKDAASKGLISLAGHRLVGGMRASLYNAVPEDGVARLVRFMREFEARHG